MRVAFLYVLVSYLSCFLFISADAQHINENFEKNSISNAKHSIQYRYYHESNDSLSKYAYLLRQNGKFEKALDLYETQLAKNTRNNNFNEIAKVNIGIAHVYREKGNYKTAYEFMNKALSLGQECKDQQVIALALSSFGSLYNNKSEYRKALEFYNKAIEKSKHSEHRHFVADNYIWIGNVMSKTGNLEDANKAYYKALQNYEEIQYDPGIASAFNNIGIIHISTGNVEKALEYYLKSMRIYQKSGDKKGLAYSYQNIGVIYQQENRIDKALDYHHKSLEIRKELNHKKGMADCYTNIGICYFDYNHTDSKKTLEYLMKGMALNKELDNHYDLAFSYNIIGDYFLAKEDKEQSLYYYQKAFDLGKKIEAPAIINESALNLYNYFVTEEDIEKALEFHQIYVRQKDLIKDKKIVEIETRYSIEKKAKEIDLLNAEKQLKEERLKAQKNWLIFISILGVAVFIFLIIVLLQSVQKNKANKELVRKNMEIVKAYQKQVKAAKNDKRTTQNHIEKQSQTPLTNSEHPQKKPDNNFTDSQKDALLEEILDYLQSEKPYLQNDFTIDKLSAALNTNRTYVSRTINDKLNKGFNQFINEYRVKEALVLLSDETREKFTLEYIAQSVGFKSKSVFNTAFKKLTGITPSFYAKSSKDINIDDSIWETNKPA